MERITQTKNKDFLRIEVWPIHNPPKNFIMLVWLTLWSVCGALVLSQLYFATEANTRVICIIYMGFWTYFELLIIKVYRWRRNGKEQVDLYKDKMIISRIIGNRGLSVEYLLSEIKGVRLNTNQKQNFFAKLLFDEYWTAGSESILFDYNGKQLGLGLQLDQDSAKKLLKTLEKLK